MLISHYFSLLQLSVHPLTYGVIFFITGIYIASGTSIVHGLSVLGFSIFLSIFITQPHWSKKALTAWCVGFFLLGYASYQRELSKHVHLQQTYGKNVCSLSGWITDKALLPSKNLHVTTLYINTIGIKGSRQKRIGAYAIRLYSSQEFPYCVGDKIALYNVTLPAVKSSASSSLNFMIKNGILFSTFVSPHKKRLRKLYSPRISVQRTMHTLRNAVYQKIQKRMTSPAFGYFSSLFLGNRVEDDATNAAMVPIFKDWGISHFLARSGLHLVIIVSMWEYLLAALPIGYLLKQIALIAMALLYALLSWTSISFMRALVTLLYTKLSRVGYKQTNGIHAISVTAFVLLMYNPACLFFPDFQLSFFLTLCLMWFNGLRHQPQKVLN